MILTPGTSEIATATASAPAIRIENLTAWYGDHAAVRGVTIDFASRAVTAIIGPSGCGKSTLLRCLNRMHEVTKNARVEGAVLLGGADIYARGIDAAEIRGRVGMVFQRPNPFPTMSVRDNVAVGPRLMGRGRGEVSDVVEWALRKANLWDEVSDKLHSPAISLSGGQQQRLCIARCLAVGPEVILMDEPCSALDPASTLRIEDLMRELAEEFTVIIVTHNMHQAARVAHQTAFMLAEDDEGGRLIEFSDTDTIFTDPHDQRTEAYVTGRIG